MASSASSPPDGLGQGGDRTAVAVHVAQHHDPLPEARRPACRSPAGTGCPVTSASSWRAAGGMRGRRRGPTMSPRTAPASTEASCSGSPTRSSAGVGPDGLEQAGHQGERDHGGLVDDDDVVRQPVQADRDESACGCPGLKPSSRCSVVPDRLAGAPGAPGRSPMAPAPRRTASSSRAAALPVGAASATSGGRCPAAAACASRRASTRATVVVFPVPGPPAITDSRAQDGGGRRHAAGPPRRRKSAASAAPQHGPSSTPARPTVRPWRTARSPPGSRPPTGGPGTRSSPPGAAGGRPRPAGCSPCGRTHVGRVRPRQRAEVRRHVRVRVGRGVDGARSTQTVPSRGARAAKAAPSQTIVVVDGAQPGQAQRDMDVGRREDAGPVEARSGPSTPHGAQGSRTGRGRRRRSCVGTPGRTGR